jgi:hypothetical protein
VAGRLLDRRAEAVLEKLEQLRAEVSVGATEAG